MLTTPSRRVLAALLAWDRQRVARVRRQTNCADYIARQDMAEVMLDVDPDAWPAEVRDLYQTLLEVHGDRLMNPAAPIVAFGVGRLRRIPALPAEGKSLAPIVEAAREIGVLPVLQGAGSANWRAQAKGGRA